MSNTAIKPEQVTTSIALAVASFYGLYSEVSETIDDGYTPYEALYEWDIVDEELIQSSLVWLDSVRLISDISKSRVMDTQVLSSDITSKIVAYLRSLELPAQRVNIQGIDCSISLEPDSVAWIAMNLRSEWLLFSQKIEDDCWLLIRIW